MMKHMSTGRDAALDVDCGAVHPIPARLVLDESTIWRSHDLFASRTAGTYHWAAHVSALAPGAIPHPPHAHKDEEILMILAGEVDIIVPEALAVDGADRLRLQTGQLAYYPSRFPHTLQTTSTDAAYYLMFKWLNPDAVESPDELRFGVFGPWEPNPVDKPDGGIVYRPVFEGPTRFLPRFQCHVSTLAAGGGYPSHVDPYDLAIVLLEGQVETLGQQVGPPAVITYPAGAAHGMHNPGDAVARYVVFEFQGTATPYWSHARHALRRMPGRALRKARRMLAAHLPGR